MVLKLFFCAETIEVYGNASSPMISVQYGVPQGCMVGPILFIMFKNDIIRSSCGTKFDIYADETSAFTSDNNLCILAEHVGNVLSDLKTWLSVNFLNLNEIKTKLIFSIEIIVAYLIFL